MTRRWRQILCVVAFALVAGIYALELSGDWDQTLNDTGDEASIVAVVFCVGAAVVIAQSVIAAMRRPRGPQPSAVVKPASFRSLAQRITRLSPSVDSPPPLSLRV